MISSSGVGRSLEGISGSAEVGQLPSGLVLILRGPFLILFHLLLFLLKGIRRSVIEALPILQSTLKAELEGLRRTRGNERSSGLCFIRCQFWLERFSVEHFGGFCLEVELISEDFALAGHAGAASVPL